MLLQAGATHTQKHDNFKEVTIVYILVFQNIGSFKFWAPVA